MKRFNFKANGHSVEFICSARNTRSGFAHDARVYIDGNVYESGKATCHYLNRTWENYAYQTVMFELAREFITEYMEHQRADYMGVREYKRMTAKRKAEFAEWIDQNANGSLTLWVNVYEQINNHGIMKPPYPDWYGIRPKTFSPSYFA